MTPIAHFYSFITVYGHFKGGFQRISMKAEWVAFTGISCISATVGKMTMLSCALLKTNRQTSNDELNFR